MTVPINAMMAARTLRNLNVDQGFLVAHSISDDGLPEDDQAMLRTHVGQLLVAPSDRDVIDRTKDIG